MPRPLRKPKKLATLNAQGVTASAPVISTPVHETNSITTRLLSPNLSPIQDAVNFPIFEDESVPLHDEFGFSQVRGIKKAVVSMPLDSDSGDDIDDNQPSKGDDVENDEDLYGVPPDPAATECPPSTPPAPIQTPKRQPKKRTRRPRTSELLCLLPARKKRNTTRPQRKQLATANSDADKDDDAAVKNGPKKGGLDKENDTPEESSETEFEVVERRAIVKHKFAEIDQWEMAFETVDLSFSSQNS